MDTMSRASQFSTSQMRFKSKIELPHENWCTQVNCTGTSLFEGTQGSLNHVWEWLYVDRGKHSRKFTSRRKRLPILVRVLCFSKTKHIFHIFLLLKKNWLYWFAITYVILLITYVNLALDFITRKLIISSVCTTLYNIVCISKNKKIKKD